MTELERPFELVGSLTPRLYTALPDAHKNCGVTAHESLSVSSVLLCDGDPGATSAVGFQKLPVRRCSQLPA
jgi:hypothetical protein